MKGKGDLKRRLARLDSMNRRPVADAGPVSAEGTGEVCRKLGLDYGADDGAGDGGDGGGDGGGAWQREYRRSTRYRPPRNLSDAAPLFRRPLPAGTGAGDLLFLDTETTGLAGGTGSLAFLVGLAWWRGGGLVVRQHFLDAPGREAPMLSEIAELARGFSAVVTFNGATFDLPLLRTRYLLARRSDPFADMHGLDLLPATRRLWNRRLANCRQQTIETEICALPRGGGDIDGALIPQVYFDFLREGRLGRLPDILRHNRRDMEGMAAILRCLAEAGAQLWRPESVGAELDWRDAWARARIAEAAGRNEVAARWLERTWDAGDADTGVLLPSECPATYCRDLLRICKRERDWRVFEKLVVAVVTRFRGEAWAHREAAILYEHRLVDLDRATAHARSCGEAGRLARLLRKSAARR